MSTRHLTMGQQGEGHCEECGGELEDGECGFCTDYDRLAAELPPGADLVDVLTANGHRRKNRGEKTEVAD